MDRERRWIESSSQELKATSSALKEALHLRSTMGSIIAAAKGNTPTIKGAPPSIDRVDAYTFDELKAIDPLADQRLWDQLSEEDQLFLTNAISQDKGRQTTTDRGSFVAMIKGLVCAFFRPQDSFERQAEDGLRQLQEAYKASVFYRFAKVAPGFFSSRAVVKMATQKFGEVQASFGFKIVKRALVKKESDAVKTEDDASLTESSSSTESAPMLLGVIQALTEGKIPPEDFNEATLHLFPKPGPSAIEIFNKTTNKCALLQVQYPTMPPKKSKQRAHVGLALKDGKLTLDQSDSSDTPPPTSRSNTRKRRQAPPRPQSSEEEDDAVVNEGDSSASGREIHPWPLPLSTNNQHLLSQSSMGQQVNPRSDNRGTFVCPSNFSWMTMC
mmetsp:Transcript_39649/g.78044  ORF Transcript_39649/g.78044 Transcript_39649/m.78044 type:complete len:385 (+) Transcript_39649:25-1179(+)